MVTLEGLVSSGRIKVDPSRNDFPVTLHDPCNLVRLMGIVEPQRRILRRIAPRFREMEPHGVYNYCCGGGSGLAIMSGHNFNDYRRQQVTARNWNEYLNAFRDELDPSIRECLLRRLLELQGPVHNLIAYYDLWEKHSIMYNGLVELIVNCMTNIKPGFIEWEQH